MKTIFSIWMQPVYARLNMGDNKVWLMLLATFPLLTMGIAVMGSYRGSTSLSASVLLIAALIGIGFVLLLILFTWFFLLVHSVALQYSPANARLAPNLKRHAQWALALPILLLSGLAAMLFGFRSIGASTSVAWLISVLALLALVASIRSKWMIAPLVAATQLPLFANLSAFSLSEIAGFGSPYLQLVLGLLMCILVLHWTFAMRADQHMQKRQQFAEIQMAMQGNPQFARRKMPKFLSAYTYLLRARLQHAQDALALLPFSLGPQAHSSSTLVQIVLITMAVSAYLFFLIARDPSASKGDELFHVFLFFPMFALMQFVFVFVALNALYQTRIEQGLASLAPRMPTHRLQTRTLLGYLLRQYFLLWGVSLLVAIASCTLFAPSPLMRDAIYLVCFCLLPLSVCLLRNHAVTKGPQDSLLIHSLMLCVAIFGVALAALIYLPSLAVWMPCTLIAVTTLLFLKWRWNKLLNMAAVFPAGRGV